MKNVNIYWIDLFAGAGGTSTGIHLAHPNTKVIACVNHDANAIKSHALNHPEAKHLMEDIRDFEVVKKLKIIVDKLIADEPGCIINIWASLECTNFSKAKGGQSRDADSRTLAEDMFMYLEHLNPDYFWVENVREFMSWGPLCENGKPISRQNGKDYIKWIDNVKSYGYKHDVKILNSADFGAYQSRERLFIQFAKQHLPIEWAEQTHTKKKEENSLFPMPQWKPVREILELEDEGVSIFNRKKDLSENTLKRIYAGLLKFVANGETEFTKRYNGGKIKPELKVNSLNKPMGTICTNGTHAIVKATHLSTYYGNFGLHSIENPSPTITTKDRVTKVDVNFIDQQFGKGTPASMDKPIGALTTIPKYNVIKAQQYLMNPSWFGNGGSIDNPSCTIIARQDKAPMYLISTEIGIVSIPVYESDSETMIAIKQFMADYGIIDIKMRMLKISELKLIQGFPKDYKLVGNSTEQKKFIGNAVEVNQAKALISAHYNAVNKYINGKDN